MFCIAIVLACSLLTHRCRKHYECRLPVEWDLEAYVRKCLRVCVTNVLSLDESLRSRQSLTCLRNSKYVIEPEESSLY
jgi:hypothetical protein